jgi:hypothetical protein
MEAGIRPPQAFAMVLTIPAGGALTSTTTERNIPFQGVNFSECIMDLRCDLYHCVKYERKLSDFLKHPQTFSQIFESGTLIATSRKSYISNRVIDFSRNVSNAPPGMTDTSF